MKGLKVETKKEKETILQRIHQQGKPKFPRPGGLEQNTQKVGRNLFWWGFGGGVFWGRAERAQKTTRSLSRAHRGEKSAKRKTKKKGKK